MRAALGLLILAGSALALYEIMNRGGQGFSFSFPNLISPPDGTGQESPVTPGYLSKLASAESGGNPLAKAASSTASGAYQFLKSTWLALGGQWGPNDALPFGGLAPSLAEQSARAAQLTAANAGQLAAAGIAPSDPALYAAHVLGASVASRVLSAPASAPLASLVPAADLAANPFLSSMTVANFIAWLQSKMG